MNTSEIISKMAFLSYSSAFIKTLTIEEPKGDYTTRGVLHLFLRADTGSVKTTIMSEIARNFKCQVVPDITGSGLVGTIDKNMNVVPGHAWLSRNKLLLLDEFSVDGNSSSVLPLLALLENQCYEKHFGRFAQAKKEKDKDLIFEVGAGFMRMKTRFSAIISTMKMIGKSRSESIEALLSRCIVIKYSLSKEELDKILDGERLMKFEKCEFKKPFDAKIKLADFMKIRECVNQYPALNEHKHYLRIVGDCCRAFAVLGKHDEQVYFLITKLHQES
jgi:hypothetical protein